MKVLTGLIVLLAAATQVQTARAQTDRAIQKSAVIDAPPSEVWKAWTTAEGLQSFMCQKASVELKLGGRYEIFFSTEPPLGERGSEGCQVQSYVPERMLSFTWNAPPAQPTMRQRRTFVVLQFTPAEGGKTKLELTHGGWKTGPEWDQTYAYFDRAWGTVLGWCQERFRSGPRDTGASKVVPDDPATVKRSDAVMADLGRLVGGTWRGEVKDGEGKPMIVEFKFRRHADGKGIVGDGLIGKGRKDVVHIRNTFGWDPVAKAVYYLDCHDSGTVYFGHVTREKEDVVFVFGPAGGDPNAFSSIVRFTGKNSYKNVIRTSKGEDIEGFTMTRS